MRLRSDGFGRVPHRVLRGLRDNRCHANGGLLRVHGRRWSWRRGRRGRKRGHWLQHGGAELCSCVEPMVQVPDVIEGCGSDSHRVSGPLLSEEIGVRGCRRAYTWQVAGRKRRRNGPDCAHEYELAALERHRHAIIPVAEGCREDGVVQVPGLGVRCERRVFPHEPDDVFRAWRRRRGARIGEEFPATQQGAQIRRNYIVTWHASLHHGRGRGHTQDGLQDPIHVGISRWRRHVDALGGWRRRAPDRRGVHHIDRDGYD
mmetsp:Transcript_94910/g.273198  ORF Transcript_94910/g.273198 Transcript_94910/m.273198 type:complete len:259 (+) Transcript_94910:185-961(+)